MDTRERFTPAEYSALVAVAASRAAVDQRSPLARAPIPAVGTGGEEPDRFAIAVAEHDPIRARTMKVGLARATDGRRRREQLAGQGVFLHAHERGEHDYPGSTLTAAEVEFGAAMRARLTGLPNFSAADALAVAAALGYARPRCPPAPLDAGGAAPDA